MKNRRIVKIVLLVLLITIIPLWSGCTQDEDCGDCTTELITHDITIDGAILRMYKGKPVIYGAFYSGYLVQKVYCYICNENVANDLIAKVKKGEMITVNVRGKLRELRAGEEQINPSTWGSDETAFTSDIQILKIKKV